VRLTAPQRKELEERRLGLLIQWNIIGGHLEEIEAILGMGEDNSPTEIPSGEDFVRQIQESIDNGTAEYK
jgi:hypothetical protein